MCNNKYHFDGHFHPSFVWAGSVDTCETTLAKEVKHLVILQISTKNDDALFSLSAS